MNADLFDQWEKASIEIERLNAVVQQLKDDRDRLLVKYQATKGSNTAHLSIIRS